MHKELLTMLDHSKTEAAQAPLTNKSKAAARQDSLRKTMQENNHLAEARKTMRDQLRQLQAA